MAWLAVAMWAVALATSIAVAVQTRRRSRLISELLEATERYSREEVHDRSTS